MALAAALEPRWQLYRLLAEPARLRLLALAAEEELSLSEIAELLDESQPNVSRHAAPLRQAGLLAERRHGTRTFVRLSDEALLDPVVKDALLSGRGLCERDGSLTRIAEIVQKRDARTREFFAAVPGGGEPDELSPEVPAYLSALSVLVPDRELAIDAGTGDGSLLDALSPMFRRVVAIDRSAAQLERAQSRAERRGYANVSFLHGEIDSERLLSLVGAGADVVVASRMLHHASRPRAAVQQLSALLKPGGRLLVIDYERHADEAFRERQADVWNGFDPSELEAHARAAGLGDVRVSRLQRGLVSSASDGHLGWQVLVGQRPPDGRPKV
jgi:DNA-binding transcriptional ArsR family regulator/protein-L-isoaspartate O-methyltransferase